MAQFIKEVYFYFDFGDWGVQMHGACIVLTFGECLVQL